MACEDPRPVQSHDPGLGLGLSHCLEEQIEEQITVFTLTCSFVMTLEVGRGINLNIKGNGTLNDKPD